MFIRIIISLCIKSKINVAYILVAASSKSHAVSQTAYDRSQGIHAIKCVAEDIAFMTQLYL